MGFWLWMYAAKVMGSRLERWPGLSAVRAESRLAGRELGDGALARYARTHRCCLNHEDLTRHFRVDY